MVVVHSDSWELRQDSSTGYCITLRVGASTGFWGGCNANFDDGRWHHVVFTADRDGSGTFYVDGKDSGSRDISSTSGQDLTRPDDMYIGGRWTDGNELDGRIR